MSKFKVGDKVQVVKGNNTDALFDVKHEKVIGKITNICGEGEYYVEVIGYTGIYNGAFRFNGEHLELIAPCVTASTQDKTESKPYNPLVAQEGGGHYKNRGIQPIEYSEANNLGACQHSVVKYITRHQEKNGIEDLSKIIHFTFLEAFFKYGEQGSTELKEKVLKLLGVVE